MAEVLQCKSPSPSMESAVTSVAQDELFERDDVMSHSYESGITLEDPEVRLAAEVLGEIHRSGDSAHSPAFLNRVSEYPLVKTAVSAYETGKSNSRGFKYAAQTIESVARPVVRRFETLDDFACRQLDRIEGRYHANDDIEAQNNLYSNRKFPVDDYEHDQAMLTSPPRSRRSSSRWHNVLSGASGLTLSLSEDSLKSLRYCVDWLQWANAHVGGLLSGLRCSVVDQENGRPRNLSEAELGALSSHIIHAKREIAETLKKLVAIVSNYAGTALPEPARSRVRAFVLGMPGRWAAKQSEGHYPEEKLAGAEDIGREYTSVVNLGSESLEVLQNVSDIVTRTLEKTQEWVEWRLRSQRVSLNAGGGNDDLHEKQSMAASAV